MNEEQIADIWTLFKVYLDKKQIEVIAEKYVDLIADYGVSDQTLKEAIGVDADLDSAIGYYLEIDADAYVDDEPDDWD
jgi:hypothetical protein